jgi:hypothetical protein
LLAAESLTIRGGTDGRQRALELPWEQTILKWIPAKRELLLLHFVFNHRFD